MRRSPSSVVPFVFPAARTTGPRRPTRSIGPLGLLGLLALAGCAHVAPYERESLSARTMDVGEAERYENSFLAHVHDSREAATGGASSTGGGCGCN